MTKGGLKTNRKTKLRDQTVYTDRINPKGRPVPGQGPGTFGSFRTESVGIWSKSGTGQNPGP